MDNIKPRISLTVTEVVIKNTHWTYIVLKAKASMMGKYQQSTNFTA